ncbi:hypothetical protein C8Q80DRAFT_1235341 [Daedaleopsis nitida]|nr:hypothetical protein C8Q80DRAFT_1235341 [Daedaleopsis nitida]
MDRRTPSPPGHRVVTMTKRGLGLGRKSAAQPEQRPPQQGLRVQRKAVSNVALAGDRERREKDRPQANTWGQAVKVAPRLNQPPHIGPARQQGAAQDSGSGASRAHAQERRPEVRDASRQAARKPPSQNTESQARRPQSSFTLVAPLLSRGLPTKAGDSRPSFMLAEERWDRSTRRKKDEYTLGITRSTPRSSHPSMSVRRRVVQSPRKTQGVHHQPQSPSTRRISARFLRDGAAPDARVHVGRGGQLVVGQSDSDETSSDESDRSIRKATARKTITRAARKTNGPAMVPQAHRAARKRNVSITSSSSSDDSSDRPRITKMARKREHVPLSDDEVIEISSSEDGLDELYDAFDALTLGLARLQEHAKLPFLRRNLRRGFEKKCRKHNVRVHPPNAPNGGVKVVYKYYLDGENSSGEGSSDDDREHQLFVGHMPDWRCPVCELHKPFPTKDMLEFHLRRDHAEVKSLWSKVTIQDVRRWQVDLIIPDTHELAESSSDEEDTVAPDADEEDEEEELPPAPPVHTELRAEFHVPQPPVMADSAQDGPPSPADPPPLPVDEEEEKKPIIEVVSDLHLATAANKSYRGSLSECYPDPPPPSDPLGPAARPPYLPTTGPDGKELYSCRIGGPRLFDLLNTLPMDELGLMSWAIIDREEEMYEWDEVPEEDRVVLALWNRWIMLKRSSFIFEDYFSGVKQFIDKYWEIIHKAAGWRALRSFLIMLCVNKYLTFDKVVQTLKHYESKTGMEQWYKDLPEQERVAGQLKMNRTSL